MQNKALEFDFRKLLFVLFSCFGFAELCLQRYNEFTWVYLMLLGIGLSVLLFFKKTLILPDKRILYFVLFSLVVTALQSLLNGAHLVEERWILRYMTLFIVFIFYQFFTEEENLIAISWPFLGIVFAYSSSSFFQYLFLYQTDAKEAFAVFGSRLWNISYYAQAMALSLPFICYFKSKNLSRSFSLCSDLTIILIFITLFASQARLSLIGLVFFFAMELFKPIGLSRKKLIGFVFLGFLINSSIWHFKTANGQPNIGSKERSVSYRSNIFSASMEMAKDFPTGVGPDRFKSTLNLYYQKDKPFSWEHTDITKTPHSDFFQVLTEDGWAIATIYALTFLLIFFVAIKSFFLSKTDHIFPRFFICLIPHIAFHFPFDLYFPTLLFALSVSNFLSSSASMIPNTRILKMALPSLGIIIFSILFVREFRVIPNQYAARYCEIFHDNFNVCKIYFGEAYLAGDLSKADQISRPIIKYQSSFFGAIAMDYSLGVEPRSQILSCLYASPFIRRG